MHWQYTPYIVPLFITAIVGGMLALAAWHRGTTGAKTFALLMVVVAVWSFGYALELAGGDLATKVFWGKFQYLGIATLPVVWFTFALHFANQSEWLTRRKLVLLAAIPLITVLLVLTTETNGLIWSQIRLDDTGPFLALGVNYGPWFYVHFAFSYVLLLVGTIILVRMLIRSAHLYRQQMSMLLIGAVAPWVGNGIYLLGLGPVPNLDLTPFAFTISGLAMGWGFYRYRLLDITPVARRAVVEMMSDIVIVLDAQNRIVDLNPAVRRIINRRASEVIGQNLDDIFAKWPDLVEQCRQTAETRAEVALDIAQTRRYFDLRLSPLTGRTNTGRLVVLRDVTKRKQVEVELALARDQALEGSRLKSQLLARVSHELRTPLGAILGYTEMLEAGVYGALSAQQRAATAEILESTGSLTRLVNQLLDQAQLDGGQLSLKLSIFSPTDIIKPIQSQMKVLAQAKGLTLTTDISPDLPPKISGDIARLQQIVINLVSNAIKFTQAGQITVSLYRPDPNHWAIQVYDTGLGVPEEAKSFIFEPFRQVDGSLTRKYGGSGLGLSIVKQLTELMNGQITVERNGDLGSTFTVLLPLKRIQETII